MKGLVLRVEGLELRVYIRGMRGQAPREGPFRIHGVFLMKKRSSQHRQPIQEERSGHCAPRYILRDGFTSTGHGRHSRPPAGSLTRRWRRGRACKRIFAVYEGQGVLEPGQGFSAREIHGRLASLRSSPGAIGVVAMMLLPERRLLLLVRNQRRPQFSRRETRPCLFSSRVLSPVPR